MDPAIKRVLDQPIDPSLRQEDDVTPSNAATMVLRLHEFAQMAQAGQLVDLVIVATMTDGGVASALSPAIGGAFRMLGALEVTKARWIQENVEL